MGTFNKGKLTNMVTYTSGKVFNECVGPIWSHVQFVGFEHKFNSGEGKELGVHANGQWWSQHGTSYVQFAPSGWRSRKNMSRTWNRPHTSCMTTSKMHFPL